MAVTLSTLLQRGYRLTFAVTIEGIPYIWTETEPGYVASASQPTVPAPYASAVPALMITEGQALSVEVDRSTGVASGKAWDMALSWRGLEDAGLLDDVFAQPSQLTHLTDDLDAGDTTITVDDTSAFASSGTVYIGREAITYTGTTSTAFTGCTRAVAGYAYDYEMSSPGYRWVTNRPMHWRGRFVTLHAHVVTPEGRTLDSAWLTGSTYLEVWKGFVDEAPRASAHAMVLRCLPLVRMAAQEIGHAAEGAVIVQPEVPYDIAGSTGYDNAVPLYVGPGGYLSFSLAWTQTGVTSGTKAWIAPAAGTNEAMTMGEWRQAVVDECIVQLASEAWWGGVAYSGGGAWSDFDGMTVNLTLTPGYVIDSSITQPGPGTYWLTSGASGGQSDADSVGWLYDLTPIYGPGWYLPVHVTEGQGWQDVTLPNAGLGVLELGTEREIIRWDDADDSDLPMVLLRVVERGIGGTTKIKLTQPTKFKSVTGDVGTVGQIIRTLLESSGTGLRGTDDTLTLGQGYGIPEAWIDTDTTEHILQNLTEIHAVSDGRSSMMSLIGGWLALTNRCLVQYTNDSGVVQLGVVDTLTVTDPTASELGADEVLMSGVAAPSSVQAPNEIEIDTSGIGQSPSVVVRDVPRIQGEGPRSAAFSAPGIDVGTAVDLGAALLALGSGVQIVRVPAAPWATGFKIGDPAVLTIAHPAIFDAATGTRAPASVPARIVAWHLDLFTGQREFGLMLAGQVTSLQYLCPTATIGTKNSTTDFDLGTGEGQWFAAGDVVTFYEQGKADTREQERTIDAVTGDNITLTSAASSWVDAGKFVTYPQLSNATTDQDDFAYVDPGTVWGA